MIMEALELVPGYSIGLLTLGDSLLLCTECIQQKMPLSKATVLYSEVTPHTTPISIYIKQQDGLCCVAKFDPFLQVLQSVAVVNTAKSSSIQQTVRVFGSQVSVVQDVLKLCGDPNHWHTTKEALLYLVYDGACFVFEAKLSGLTTLQGLRGCGPSKLIEARIFPLQHSPLCSLLKLTESKCNTFDQPFQVRLVVNEDTKSVCGIDVLHLRRRAAGEENSGIYTCTALLFCCHTQDVLGSIGPPDEVCYKDTNEFFFNYKHLGLDILFSGETCRAKKFILHANAPGHFEFTSYSRCSFMFSITSDSIATHGQDTLLVTPDTHWASVRRHVNSTDGGGVPLRKLHTYRCRASTNTSFPFHPTDMWELFGQLVVDTTAAGYIAKITVLFRDPLALGAAHSLRRTDQKLLVRDVAVKQIEEGMDDDGDEEDDDGAFHSAESSLNTEAMENPLLARPVSSRAAAKCIFTPSVPTVVHSCYTPCANTVLCVRKESPPPVLVDTKDLTLAFLSDSEEPVCEENNDTEATNSLVPFTDIHLSEIAEHEMDTFDIVEPLILQLPSNEDKPQMDSSEQEKEEDNIEEEEHMFSYQPSSECMTTSRVLRVSQEVKAGPVGTRTRTKPSALRPKTNHSTNWTSTSISGMSGSSTDRFSRKQAQSRILAHTETSQQRIRKKYQPSKGGEEEEEEEEEEKEGEVDNGGTAESLSEGACPDPVTRELDSSGHEEETAKIDASCRMEEDPEEAAVFAPVPPHSSLDLSSLDLGFSSGLLTASVCVSDIDCNTASQRREWEEGQVLQYGPASVTEESVLLEVISSEHQEVHDVLNSRNVQLKHLCQKVLNGSSNVRAVLESVTAGGGHDTTLLPDLLSALCHHRDLWSIQFAVDVLPFVEKLFSFTVEERYTLVGCEAVSVIAERHEKALQRHKTGVVEVCRKSLGRILDSLEKLKDQRKQEDATGQDGCRLSEQVDHLLELLNRILRKPLVCN